MNLMQLLEVTVTGMGYEVVDVERSPKGRTIRIFIDKQDKPGGIDVEDCSRVSNQLSRVFMVENVDYDRLEVSSPGLDRPLVKPADFERFSGQPVTVRLRLPVDGRRRFSGMLLGIAAGKVRLRLENEKTPLEVELDYDNIEKARLEPVF